MNNYLESLGAMMGCAMVFGSSQESGVIGLFQVGHQCRNELICRKASQFPVFRGNDHIKPPERHGDFPFMPETAQGRAGRYYT